VPESTLKPYTIVDIITLESTASPQSGMSQSGSLYLVYNRDNYRIFSTSLHIWTLINTIIMRAHGFLENFVGRWRSLPVSTVLSVSLLYRAKKLIRAYRLRNACEGCRDLREWIWLQKIPVKWSKILASPTPFHSSSLLLRARICKPFKVPRNRFPASPAGTTTLFDVSTRQAT